MQKKSKKFVPSSNPDDLRNWKWRNAIYIYLYKLACIFLLLYNQVKIALKNGFFWYTHTQIKYLFIIISFLANGNRNFSLSEAASVTSGYGNNKQRQLKLCKPPKEQKKNETDFSGFREKGLLPFWLWLSVRFSLAFSGERFRAVPVDISISWARACRLTNRR